MTGLDISKSFVEIAQTNARQAGVTVDFRHGNAAAMPFAGALLPRTPAVGLGERVRYADVLRLPGAWTGYLSTFAYMIAFYQTYTFIGDHVRQTHGAGAWLGGSISLSYGLGFGLGVVFDKWIDAKGPVRMLPLGLTLVGINYLVLPFAAERIVTE